MKPLVLDLRMDLMQIRELLDVKLFPIIFFNCFSYICSPKFDMRFSAFYMSVRFVVKDFRHLFFRVDWV